jgi:WD40 repeat protein
MKIKPEDNLSRFLSQLFPNASEFDSETSDNKFEENQPRFGQRAISQTMHLNSQNVDWVTAMVPLDNGCLVAGFWGGVIGAWNETMRTPLTQWKAHISDRGDGHSINALTSLNGDGRLASAAFDGIKLWDLTSGKHLDSLKGNTSDIYSIAPSKDGRLLTSGVGKSVKVWDLRTNECIATLVGHTKDIRAMVCLENNRLVSAAADETIKLFDLRTHGCSNTLRGHTGWIMSLSSVIAEYQIASGATDKTIKLWDLNTGTCLKTLRGHETSVDVVCHLGDCLASGSEERTVRLWDLKTGKCSQVVSNTDHIKCMIALGDRKIASAEGCGIQIWEL